jgi:glycosyltransferase involved in cell wall biosynthesis
VRLLFVSGTPTGGSALSTRQLAHRLAARGHDVGLLVHRRTRPRAGLVAPPRDRRINWITTAPGRVCRALRRAATTQPRGAGTSEGVEEWTSVAPEQVLPSLCVAWRPCVVIVSSVHRRAWMAIHTSLRRARIPVVFYVRETATFEHVPIAELLPDLTVTNSDAHRRRAEELGVQACTIPSLIEVDQCDEQTTREVALFVNPLPSRGLAVAVALARERPDVHFAFQLSWPLRRRDHRALRSWIRDQPNIELRTPEQQCGRVYRDARVLVLPYQVDQRPRVVLEAQWNGIPVVATDLSAHREAVGSGGLFVAADAPPTEWATAFGALWDDKSHYERVCVSARAYARRDDQDPARIAARFESLMERVLRGGGVPR